MSRDNLTPLENHLDSLEATVHQWRQSELDTDEAFTLLRQEVVEAHNAMLEEHKIEEADPYSAFVAAFAHAFNVAHTNASQMSQAEYETIMQLAFALIDSDNAVGPMLDTSSM
jgi:hypothetical protein